MKKGTRTLAIGATSVVALAVIAGVVFHKEVVTYAKRLPLIRALFVPTVEGKVAEYGPAARARLRAKFDAVGLKYPPNKVEFIAIKDSKTLEVHAGDSDDQTKYVCTYPILGASGHLGPKLREGDCQVPEGIYELTYEPNTPYHVALRLNYPNDFDLARAREDNRANPGSDILIHGKTCSIGCLAMGDEASEDLFVLAHDTNNFHLPLIIAPVDLRSKPAPEHAADDPIWLSKLYLMIKTEMDHFQR